MNILVYGAHRTGDLAWFIARNLQGLGHKVEIIDLANNQPQDSFLSRARYKLPLLEGISVSILNKRILNYLLRRKPHLVIVCKGSYILPQTLKGIRKQGIRVVNWYPDGVTEILRKFILESIPEYDLFFTKEPYLLRRLSESGLSNVCYLPHCCDPQIHRSIAVSQEDKGRYASNLSIVGSWYAYREQIVLPLAGYDFKIWGKGWGRAGKELKVLWQGREAVGDEQALVFNATDININTGHLQDIEGVNQRVFDLAGCGAFQLSHQQADLPNLFDAGREIIVYKDRKELKELADYYLKHEDERRAIAQKAQERAYRQHTYKHRLQQILNLLGMD